MLDKGRSGSWPVAPCAQLRILWAPSGTQSASWSTFGQEPRPNGHASFKRLSLIYQSLDCLATRASGCPGYTVNGGRAAATSIWWGRPGRVSRSLATPSLTAAGLFDLNVPPRARKLPTNSPPGTACQSEWWSSTTCSLPIIARRACNFPCDTVTESAIGQNSVLRWPVEPAAQSGRS